MKNTRFTPEYHRRWILLGSVLAIGFAIMPYLFWRQTWFGRPLTPDEIGRYLDDDARPRHIQHALAQVSERMARRDPGAGAFYGRVVLLGTHPLVEIRTAAAWLMGQDNTCPAFHKTLLAMLQDRDVMVRRNAALSLVRFRDPTGRPELLAMLEPYEVAAPTGGILSLQVHVGHEVARGTVLACLTSAHGGEVQVRSPVAGAISSIHVAGRSAVQAGWRLLSVSPEPDQAWEALRGLYLIGEPEDIRTVQSFEAATNLLPRLREQAALTARAIRTRSEQSPTR